MAKPYVIALPFLQISPFDCGPASFVIVLSVFYKKRRAYRSVTEAEVILRSGANKEDGLDEDGIKRAADFFNLYYEDFSDGTIQKLKNYLEKGCPIIIHWAPDARSNDRGSHWSVVTMIRDDEITIFDPGYKKPKWPNTTYGIQTIKINKFIKLWQTSTGPDDSLERYGIAFALGKKKVTKYKSLKKR